MPVGQRRAMYHHHPWNQETDVFDRSCVSQLGMRGISCNQFSLQRAPHAGVFEAAAFFFDAHEESLGPARDAPLHRVLIHLGPRGEDGGFHLHFVLGLACEALLQHFVDLVLPSRPDVVVERVEIWRICRNPGVNSVAVGGHFAASPRQFVSWRICGCARPSLLHDKSMPICAVPSECRDEPRARGIQGMPFRGPVHPC